ncbi:hypothetical protein [Gracilimonas mengyeensis]|uniref:Uncharacterized protein n=1 Tax=Gracilimonas mengyeensis TaxID=1302730 RepID=A0A521EC70_9BACT|nr:hypothetical protein [Gracilimonas mengyeensis]SMO80770.1 hypothetical protein SAMN06265219_11160 [Gracilimonas mengyeensis]
MKQSSVILFLLLVTASLILQNCSQSGPCEGSLTLENPIPDTTVAVGDTLFIDLTGPPVFVSSKGRVSYLPVLQSGYLNVDINQIANQADNGKLSILRIIGIEIGEAILDLQASSGCLENQLTITINITEP